MTGLIVLIVVLYLDIYVQAWLGFSLYNFLSFSISFGSMKVEESWIMLVLLLLCRKVWLLLKLLLLVHGTSKLLLYINRNHALVMIQLVRASLSKVVLGLTWKSNRRSNQIRCWIILLTLYLCRIWISKLLIDGLLVLVDLIRLV